MEGPRCLRLCPGACERKRGARAREGASRAAPGWVQALGARSLAAAAAASSSSALTVQPSLHKAAGGGGRGRGGGRRGVWLRSASSHNPVQMQKKKKKGRVRERPSASRAWGCVGRVCTENQFRCARDRGSLLLLFALFLLFLISFPKDFYLGEELNSSSLGAMRACPHQASLQICLPPFPWVTKCLCTAQGVHEDTRVHRRGSACAYPVALEGTVRSYLPIHKTAQPGLGSWVRISPRVCLPRGRN